jgi:putative intracellular protease/amidase
MQIAAVLFPRLTALDLVGPYEVLQRLPDATVTFVGAERGQVRSDNGFLGLMVDATFSDLPDPDVIIVPGGVGARDLMHGSDLLDWLRDAHRTSLFTTSVCTGSLLLAAAGLLEGLTATTHWTAMGLLGSLGAVPTAQRVVEHPQHRLVTAAGVSAGIDMALRLASLLTDEVTAQAQQLMIEYDPQPPFDAGSPAAAGPHVLARARELSAFRD